MRRDIVIYAPMSTELIFVVYFVYGLAFFGMGLALALESGRAPALAEARVLYPLSAFGLLHGTHEWLEAYLLQAVLVGFPLPGWAAWVRLLLLITSFSSLMLFALNLHRLTSPRYDSRRILYLGSFAIYATGMLASGLFTYQTVAVPWLNLVDGLSRYLLAVPASVMATITLFAWARKSRSERRKVLALSLSFTALGFMIYALTQFIVRPIAIFPATLINEASFLATFGFPIQVIRTFVAVLITISLLRAIFTVDNERKQELFAAQQSRLEALQNEQALRRELLMHTVRTQEEERARIAREIHDETAQQLSAVILELATLRSMLKRQKAASEKVDQLQTLARQISQGLYRLVRDLRPAQLDDLGLVPALRYLIGQYHLTMNVDAAFKVQGDVRRLDRVMETVLFRVVQEALTNVARHARTHEAEVELDYGRENICLTVADKGQGFDALQGFAGPRGWGLAGMRERVESVGGEFHIASAHGEGTIIEVRMNLTSA